MRNLFIIIFMLGAIGGCATTSEQSKLQFQALKNKVKAEKKVERKTLKYAVNLSISIKTATNTEIAKGQLESAHRELNEAKQALIDSVN